MAQKLKRICRSKPRKGWWAYISLWYINGIGPNRCGLADLDLSSAITGISKNVFLICEKIETIKRGKVESSSILRSKEEQLSC